jgi:hypothetical protein
MCHVDAGADVEHAQLNRQGVGRKMGAAVTFTGLGIVVKNIEPENIEPKNVKNKPSAKGSARAKDKPRPKKTQPKPKARSLAAKRKANPKAKAKSKAKAKNTAPGKAQAENESSSSSELTAPMREKADRKRKLPESSKTSTQEDSIVLGITRVKYQFAGDYQRLDEFLAIAKDLEDQILFDGATIGDLRPCVAVLQASRLCPQAGVFESQDRFAEAVVLSLSRYATGLRLVLPRLVSFFDLKKMARRRTDESDPPLPSPSKSRRVGEVLSPTQNSEQDTESPAGSKSQSSKAQPAPAGYLVDFVVRKMVLGELALLRASTTFEVSAAMYDAIWKKMSTCQKNYPGEVPTTFLCCVVLCCVVLCCVVLCCCVVCCCVVLCCVVLCCVVLCCVQLDIVLCCVVLCCVVLCCVLL